ncbi:MAG: ABC transporter permease [Streptomyces sp.]|nr:ABC transporter permease [Streptomyces sp.]
MRPALHAEWTKIRTVTSPLWLLLGMIAATVALGAAATSVVTCASAGCGDMTKLSLIGVQLGQALVVILAVLVIAGEYGTGMIRTTLAAMPHRATVLAAKAVTLTGIVAAAGTIAVLGSLMAGRLLLPGHAFTITRGHPPLSVSLSPTDGPTLRAALGSILYLTLIALFSLGVATVVRDSATSIGIVLGLLYLVPVLSQLIGDPHWQRLLQRIGPMSAGLAVQATTDVRSLPIGPWAGLGVTAGWAAAALLAGGLLLRMRDT